MQLNNFIILNYFKKVSNNCWKWCGNENSQILNCIILSWQNQACHFQVKVSHNRKVFIQIKPMHTVCFKEFVSYANPLKCFDKIDPFLDSSTVFMNVKLSRKLPVFLSPKKWDLRCFERTHPWIYEDGSQLNFLTFDLLTTIYSVYILYFKWKEIMYQTNVHV